MFILANTCDSKQRQERRPRPVCACSPMPMSPVLVTLGLPSIDDDTRERSTAETPPSGQGPLYTASARPKLTCKTSSGHHNACLSELCSKHPPSQEIAASSLHRNTVPWCQTAFKYCTRLSDSSLTFLLKYHQAELPDCWNTEIKLLKRNPSTLVIF